MEVAASRGGPISAFGEPPFDDVAPGDPLFGRRVTTVPESAVLHAAALGLLPEWNRYWSHVVTRGHEPGSPGSYASSALRRLTRVILQRDRARQIVLQSPTPDDAEELADMLTLAFVHLMGTFDALAQVAARVTELEIDQRSVVWQNPRFSKLLNKCAPTLAALFEEGAEGALSLAAIRAVRNTIHKQMPNPAEVHRDRGDPADDHISILFERGAHDEVLAALDAAGWSKFIFSPGVHPESLRDAPHVDFAGVTRADGLLIVRPETLLASGLGDGVRLFNVIMAATPVETLGEPIQLLDPAKTLYPLSLQRYAIHKLGLMHLAGHLDVGR